MTSESHRSGTDRCAEAAATSDADVIINVQGDEPFIDPAQLQAVMSCFDDPETQSSDSGTPLRPCRRL